MRPFAKQTNCPAAKTLLDYNEGALPVLAQQSVAAHLNGCEFCAAEAALLERQRTQVETSASVAPPVPLAVRLLAQALLPQQAQSNVKARRAA